MSRIDDETFCCTLEGLGLFDSAQAVRRGEASRSAVVASVESQVKRKQSFLDATPRLGGGGMHDRIKAWCAQAEDLIEREELTTGPYVRVSVEMVSGHLGLHPRAAYNRLGILEVKRLLGMSFAQGRNFYYLTQLGREALEGSK